MAITAKRRHLPDGLDDRSAVAENSASAHTADGGTGARHEGIDPGHLLGRGHRRRRFIRKHLRPRCRLRRNDRLRSGFQKTMKKLTAVAVVILLAGFTRT